MGAGVRVNEEGTTQGGLISPLLANVYLDIMDEWISSQWERKKTHTAYSRPETRLHALRKRSNLIPGYLVRYADSVSAKWRGQRGRSIC